MKKTFIDRIDKCLLLVWEIFFFICSIILLILEGMLFFLIKLLFKGKRLRKLKECVSYFFKIITNFFSWLKSYFRTSRKSCRMVSIFIFFIFLLYSFPFYMFGNWKFYERGVASYYSWGFYCRSAASGEIYWPWKYGAAHKNLPIGKVIKVVNLENGRVIYVRIFDRGPFVKGRILDLTRRAAHDLGIVENGTANVEIYVK